MGKSIKFRTALRAKLLTLCPLGVFYKQAEGTTPEQYIVFDLDNVTYGETVDQIKLDVHILGAGADTTNAENLADNVWNALGHYTYYDPASGIGFTCYPSVRYDVTDSDNSIIERRMSFTVRNYGG